MRIVRCISYITPNFLNLCTRTCTAELPIRSWQLKDLSSQKRATLRQESDRTNEVEYVFFSFLCLFDLPLRKTNVLVKWP